MVQSNCQDVLHREQTDSSSRNNNRNNINFKGIIITIPLSFFFNRRHFHLYKRHWTSLALPWHLGTVSSIYGFPIFQGYESAAVNGCQAPAFSQLSAGGPCFGAEQSISQKELTQSATGLWVQAPSCLTIRLLPGLVPRPSLSTQV